MMSRAANSIRSGTSVSHDPGKGRETIMHETLQYLATFLNCHRIADRCFSLRGRIFPVCARCTGVGCGQLVAVAALVGGLRIGFTPCLCLMTVMFVDWFIQYTGLIESTNPRRFLTGLLGGFGYVCLLVDAAAFLLRAIH